MAVGPNGPIPLSYFSQKGTEHGDAAARLKRPRSAVDQDMAYLPEFQDPRYQATSEDRGTYRTAWLNRYDYVIKQLTPQEQEMAKVATAQEEQKLTVDQWEQQTEIPGWSIARAVASNFDPNVTAFTSRMTADTATLMKSAAGQDFLKRAAGYVAQWRATFTAIQASAPPLTPSSAVAEVRKARAALGVLESERSTLMKAPAVMVDAADKKVTAVPDAGAKAKIPGWAFLAGLLAAAGGVFLMFRKKKPAALPPRRA